MTVVNFSMNTLPLQTAAQLLQAMEQRRQRAVLATGVAPFDRLQDGGLARGAFVELAGPRSSGRFAILLAALASATRAGEAAALVDLGDHLGPGDAEAAGADLRRVLWIRPRTLKEAVMSAEMILSAGFAFVALDLGSRPLPLHRVPPSVWVRLARAAETHNGILLLTSPTPVRPASASAVVAASHARAAWQGEGDAPRLLSGIAARLSVERRRGGRLDAAAAPSAVSLTAGPAWAEGA